MSDPAKAKTAALRALPSVDQLLRTPTAMRLRELVGAPRLATIARNVTEEIRSEIQADETSGISTREALLDQSVMRLEKACAREGRSRIRRVINGTGVILHTNLGRAPLGEAARQAIAREGAGYCTLEYDLESGSRGRRGAYVEDLLIELTGAEDALVVNNCAAAALLILSVLAGDGETIVSRGELVEIGGDFRVPDVMASSGTRMIEVGTTNRTRLDDYRRAITERTRLIMRVHPSNYRIVGFTAAPTLSDLAALAHEANLILFEDAGSGVLADLADLGLGDEPIIRDCISSGADVVSFSGDKLLGAPQAGLIVGRAKIVSRFRPHPLYRALRADKLSLVALAATLEAHRRGTARQEIPALRMLATAPQEIEDRAKRCVEMLTERFRGSPLQVSIVRGQSAVGGGAGPNTHPPTALICLQHETLSADEIQLRLRLSSTPVIARIAEQTVLIDLRTVGPDEELELLGAISRLTQSHASETAF